MSREKSKIIHSWSYRHDVSKAAMLRYAAKWEGLPLPRLQMRWAEKPTPKSQLRERSFGGAAAWDCFYELVLPVDKFDIRNEGAEVGFILVPIGHSRRHSDRRPCEQGPTDTPYRDSAHAYWDSKALGWLPIFIVAPDGSIAQKVDYFEAPTEWDTPVRGNIDQVSA